MDRENVSAFIGFLVVLAIVLTGMFGLPVAAYYIVQHQSSAAFEMAIGLLLISALFWYAVISSFLERDEPKDRA